MGIPSVYIDDGLMSDIQIEDIIRDEVRIEAIKVVKKEMSLKGQKGRKTVIDDCSILKTVEDIMSDIMSSRDTVVNVVDIKNYDEYTFAHSVNVCMLAVLTGRSLGYSKKELMKLGMGAILHDIGKTQLPEDILNKPGRLTDKEFDAIKKHAEYGYEILKEQPGLSSEVAVIAYQHHERYSGEGYPLGLKKDMITDYAKITGIADVYDALTSDRVYRKGYAPHEVYEMLAGQGNTSFDFNILKAFLDNIAVYPVGTILRLNTGEIAGVTKVYRGITHRPVVRVLFDANGNKVAEQNEIDLTKDLKVAVEDVLKEEDLQMLKFNKNDVAVSVTAN